MVGWFTILVLSLIFCFTILLLHGFPSKNTPILVYFLVFIGWFTSFGIVALLPYDIFLTKTEEGDEQLLHTAWIVVYWLAFGLCWLLLPLTEKFHTSGEFSFFAKLKGAVFRQIRSFLIIISLGVVLVIYIYFVEKLTLDKVPEILVLMSNIWGLFLIITLLGFGLVAIPMNCWRQGSLSSTMDRLSLQAVPLDETFIDARYRLDQCVGRILKLSQEIPLTSTFRPFIEIILAKCPEGSKERHQNKLPQKSENKSEKPLRLADLKHSDLVNLHKELKDLISENLRSEWYVLDRVGGKSLLMRQ
jgi:hypothetical protein